MNSLHSVQVKTCWGRTSEQEIPNDLIEASLALTGKTTKDMYDWGDTELFWDDWDIALTFRFSYPKFFYYLLSPEFIEKYENNTRTSQWHTLPYTHIKEFWKAIYEYQKWKLLFSKGEITEQEMIEKYNKPLISLLSKI